MKFAEDIILSPIVTEESMLGMSQKKYTFKVKKTADKTQIKEAIEKLFGVNVKSVNTMNVSGPFRRYGKYEGYKSDWKKAIVTLTEESKNIEFFDNLM